MTAPLAASFAVVTLGCPKNEADSDRLEAALTGAGHRVAPPSSADLILVNTCGFIDDAKQESIDALLEACEAAHARGARVAAYGCLVARHGAELRAAMPELDVLSAFDLQPILELLAGLRVGGGGGARRPRRRPSTPTSRSPTAATGAAPSAPSRSSRAPTRRSPRRRSWRPPRRLS